ncbi:MAG: hypothetical protein ACYTBJ_26430 [Planctomycetota bacterium]|jgi:hypothetical protein
MSSVIGYFSDPTFHDKNMRHGIKRLDIGEVLIRMNDDMEITWMNIENSYGPTMYAKILTTLKNRIEHVPSHQRVLVIRELLMVSMARRGMLTDPLSD